jgi:mono/diheme cytochrome c family protein
MIVRSSIAWEILGGAALCVTAVAFGRADELPDDAGSPPQAAAESPLDFEADIRPIFVRHCYGCHGPEKQDGGLRLDSLPAVRAGGDSGRPILGNSEFPSELLRRVQSSDMHERMPLGAEPLSEQQLDTLRRWIARGAPWPEPPRIDRRAGSQGGFWLWFGPVLDRLIAIHQHVQPLEWVAVTAALLLILLVERSKQLWRRGHRWALGSARPWFAACAAVGVTHYLLLVAGLGLWGLWRYAGIVEDRAGRLSAELVQLRESTAPSAPTLQSVYGDPPIPHRPHHPPRLGGTYYRGNDERNERLFNGGNYRTATFELTLCDAQGRRLHWGDAIPADGWKVVLDIHRSPHAAASLFTDDIMSGVFLSSRPQGLDGEQPAADRAYAATIEPGEHWRLEYPLPAPEPSGHEASGIVYVCQARPSRGEHAGTPHYGISYQLHWPEGRIAPQSELWMGNLFVLSHLHFPEPGKVPLNEWFDFLPIPEIEGDNTSDPRLLGVYDHLPLEAPPRR